MTSDGANKPTAKKPRAGEALSVHATALLPYDQVFVSDTVVVDRAGCSIAASDLPAAQAFADAGMIRLDHQPEQE